MENPNIESRIQDKRQNCQPGYQWDPSEENCVGMSSFKVEKLLKLEVFYRLK